MIVDPTASTLVAVCGAHLRGQPLHPVLLALGAVLVRAARTAPIYRMVLLPGSDAPGGVPHARPGLIRCRDGGASVEVEVYRMAVAALGQLLVTVISPLAIGSVVLEDGATVPGFVCEGFAAGDPDITGFGSWRNYLASVD